MSRIAVLRSALLPAALVSALGAACGADDGPLVLEAGTVVRSCTTKVAADRPFGSMNPVDRYSIEFRVPDTVTSFLVSAWDHDASTTIAALNSPSGVSYDLVVDDAWERYHPAAMASLFGVPVDVDRFMVPPEPSLATMVEPGVWEVRGDTGSGRLCVSIAASDRPGAELDLVVYLVGIPGLVAGSAPNDDDWAAVLDRVGDVFAQVDLAIDAAGARYVDMGMVEQARFSVLRSWDDFQELIATSTDPPRDAGGPLRLNVFLVRGFAGDMPTGLLGVSSGIPGAAGVHGTSDSGIVFGVEDYLGVDDVGEGVTGNEYLGDVMAHEIGHYLGLFHTTEWWGDADPLDDTPECPQLVRAWSADDMRDSCDDVGNLMFPFAIPGTENALTEGQAATMRANPLLRPLGG